MVSTQSGGGGVSVSGRFPPPGVGRTAALMSPMLTVQLDCSTRSAVSVVSPAAAPAPEQSIVVKPGAIVEVSTP